MIHSRLPDFRTDPMHRWRLYTTDDDQETKLPIIGTLHHSVETPHVQEPPNGETEETEKKPASKKKSIQLIHRFMLKSFADKKKEKEESDSSEDDDPI